MTRYYDRQAVSGQLVSYSEGSYLERTSRPIYAMVYLVGFMLVFIVGTILIAMSQSINEPQVRVVAFIWVQSIMEFIGFSPRLALITTPFVVVVILLALQITSQKPWWIKVEDMFLMAIECVLLTTPLIVLSLLLNREPPAEQVAALTAHVPVSANLLWVDIVTGIGAGIYEELVFRLVLICLLMLFFQDVIGMRKKLAVALSVLISAVLFSAHHHIFFAHGQFHHGDVFTLGKFFFRAIAGVYFAVLYAARGFGITAGTHAFYNVLAAILRTVMFAAAVQ